jgi:hypothetical protein
MMKHVTLCLLATLLAGCTFTPAPQEDLGLNDEGRVIVSWVNLTLEKTPQKHILILDSTILSPGPCDVLEADFTPTETMFSSASIDGKKLLVEKATIESFRKANTQPQPFTCKVSFAAPHSIITRKTIDPLFQNKDGWKQFDKRYPESHGYFSFARVGFNQGKTEALLYVEEHAGWLHGGGRYVLFRKHYGIWRYMSERGTWVS